MFDEQDITEWKEHPVTKAVRSRLREIANEAVRMAVINSETADADELQERLRFANTVSRIESEMGELTNADL